MATVVCGCAQKQAKKGKKQHFTRHSLSEKSLHCKPACIYSWILSTHTWFREIPSLLVSKVALSIFSPDSLYGWTANKMLLLKETATFLWECTNKLLTRSRSETLKQYRFSKGQNSSYSIMLWIIFSIILYLL